MTGSLLSLLDRDLVTYDLSQPLTNGMTCSDRHPGFRLSMLGRHGDLVRPDGVSAAYEIIVTGGHVGTHLDALSHISHDGLLHGGVDADAAQRGGVFSSGGIEEFPVALRRGVLLDVAARHGTDTLPAGYGVTAEDLDDAAAAAGLRVRPGDAVLVRTGLGAHFADAARYLGHDTGSPGITGPAATWIAEHGAILAGADTAAFDQVPDGRGAVELPAHRILLVERGINIIENLNLEAPAAAGVHEFLFVAVPLRIPGATGSPVRPLAITERR